MTTETRFIQSGHPQIQPRSAQTVRTGAKSTQAFADVLGTHAKAVQEGSKAEDSTLAPVAESDLSVEEAPSEEIPSNTEDDVSGVPKAHPDDSSVETTEKPVDVPVNTAQDAQSNQPIDEVRPQSEVPSESQQQPRAEPNADVQTDQSSAPAETPVARNEQPARTQGEQPVAPDLFVALSRQAQQSKFEIQGIARELTHAANVDVAKIAQSELTTNAKLGSDVSAEQAPVLPADDSEPVQGVARPFLTLRTNDAPVELSQSTLPNRSVPQAAQQQGAERPQVPQIPTPTTQTAENTAQSAPVIAVPDAIRSVLDRIQSARSLISSGAVVGSAGARANPAGVTAVASAQGNSIGANTQGSVKSALAQPADTTSRINRREIMAQVQKGLASILKVGKGSMTIRLNPEHLGELRIRVQTKDGTIRASFEAQTEGARDAIEKGLGSLREHLENKGVRVDELRVEQRENESANANTGAKQQHANQNEAKDNRFSESIQEDQQASGETADGIEHSTSRGIWTELGLDAVA